MEAKAGKEKMKTQRQNTKQEVILHDPYTKKQIKEHGCSTHTQINIDTVLASDTAQNENIVLAPPHENANVRQTEAVNC